MLITPKAGGSLNANQYTFCFPAQMCFKCEHTFLGDKAKLIFSGKQKTGKKKKTARFADTMQPRESDDRGIHGCTQFILPTHSRRSHFATRYSFFRFFLKNNQCIRLFAGKVPLPLERACKEISAFRRALAPPPMPSVRRHKKAALHWMLEIHTLQTPQLVDEL